MTRRYRDALEKIIEMASDYDEHDRQIYSQHDFYDVARAAIESKEPHK